MSQEDIDNSDGNKPTVNLFSPFINFLILLAKGLRNQRFIFVLLMTALIIVTFWLSQQIGSFTPMYVVVASIIILVFMALWADANYGKKNTLNSVYKNSSSTSLTSNKNNNKTKGSRNKNMSQFDKLRDWLDNLVDSEFRDMMNSLLTTKEINHLPRPLDQIDRGAFLGQMKIYNRLNDVEKYIQKNFSERIN
jgi:hypothetical protein